MPEPQEEVMLYGFGDVEEEGVVGRRVRQANRILESLLETPTLISTEPPQPPHIPNTYTKWTPTERNSLPPDVEQDSMVKIVFRSGQPPSRAVSAGQYFWGDTDSASDIVAYRVIKLEKGWTDWGRILSESDWVNYVDDNDIPRGTNAHQHIQVWLRGSERPQSDIRQAQDWHWDINDLPSDIMRYRVVSV